MKIEHLAIWVNDLEKMKKFYEQYFNAQSNLRKRCFRSGKKQDRDYDLGAVLISHHEFYRKYQ